MEHVREPAAGDLLVASTLLGDGVFDQSVILVLDHDEQGSIGIVLNRLSDIELADVLPQWESQVSDPRAVFDGGPVSRNGAICLASLTTDEEPPGWRRLHGDVGILHLDTPVEIVDGAFRDVRIYAGYAGWDPGQLVSELVQGAWHVVPAQYSDVFTTAVDGLWRAVLRRQPGALSLYASWAPDPSAN